VNVTVETAYSNDVAKGYVISQTPVSSSLTQYSVNVAIKIVVSAGKEGEATEATTEPEPSSGETQETTSEPTSAEETTEAPSSEAPEPSSDTAEEPSSKKEPED
jgi:beta-lactam-binding protein with PASTA domain